MASIHRAVIFFHLLLTSLKSTCEYFPSQVNEKKKGGSQALVRCTTAGLVRSALDPNPPKRTRLPSFRSFPPSRTYSYGAPAPPLFACPADGAC